MGCIESDHILLAELAMLGRLVEIPSSFIVNAGTHSTRILWYRTAADLLAWHDPRKAKDRILLPHWARRDLDVPQGYEPHSPSLDEARGMLLLGGGDSSMAVVTEGYVSVSTSRGIISSQEESPRPHCSSGLRRPLIGGVFPHNK